MLLLDTLCPVLLSHIYVGEGPDAASSRLSIAANAIELCELASDAKGLALRVRQGLDELCIDPWLRRECAFASTTLLPNAFQYSQLFGLPFLVEPVDAGEIGGRGQVRSSMEIDWAMPWATRMYTHTSSAFLLASALACLSSWATRSA